MAAGRGAPVRPDVAAGLPAFWITLGVALPVSLAAAWAFCRAFELPFQRYRGWAALWAAAKGRAGRPRGAARRSARDRPTAVSGAAE